jgi:hypothetical protein
MPLAYYCRALPARTEPLAQHIQRALHPLLLQVELAHGGLLATRALRLRSTPYLPDNLQLERIPLQLALAA